MSPQESRNFYYNTIRDASTLARASQGQPALETLLRSGWKSAVSQWGREQLLAHRVVCSEPSVWLALLNGLFRDPGTAHECIAELVKGPASIDALKHSSEPQIVQRHQPDSVGYVWAALLPFLRAAARSDPPAASTPSTPKQKRERKAPERYGGGVPSDQADLGSSPDYKQRPTTSGSHSSFSSVGYMDKLEAPLLEDATIRVTSSFSRCVLNYGQPMDKREPFLEYRDERLTYSYKLGAQEVHAVDDGGIQVFEPGLRKWYQVAQLEGKRAFQKITDGVADITDELLGQMVGEALALQQNSQRTKQNNIRTDFVTILAATHCVRLFHFHIPVDYIESYNNLSSTGPGQAALKGVLRANSTPWLDIKLMDHRKIIASHILALVAWANQELA
ncbi:Uncharacterized protein TPAR_05587 [Tolypocladium paradoxum]|uniref:Uncharacterized protein n=1 Tax=Tolypocladium paradoxum TaxID=94208 RepID=A0A2S4KVJ4_9HYPO|nr:Uncharacterized protein TPAR_05587 [Tolypocladium paradoxum]